ncbi:MAG: xylulokinase [Lachnospiraceae bacterium]
MKALIESGKAVLGIEFGSTRIKAILIDEKNQVIASGDHEWENQLENKIWTYSLDAIWTGLQDCYASLLKDVKEKYDTTITSLAAIGFSGMMHGYMPFNKDDELLVPFRTWRNTITGPASDELSELFGFHIPQRWSIAHLYQAILNGEDHVGDITFFTTLAGYIHWKLSGRKVMGIGEASGMFPIDVTSRDYDKTMIEKFDKLVAPKGFAWKLEEILPKVLVAGENAGTLTEEGAKLLDVSGNLKAGVPMCPPEGDAGTGMVATNAVAVRTGNVSAGTSCFGMAVLEKDLSKAYPEIDIVTTPVGDGVAMIHCNNCTSDLNAWVGIFKEFADAIGADVDMGKLFGTLYNKSLEGDKDCGGLLAYNYFSGEHVTGFEEGRPMFVRKPDSKFTLANFMRANLYTTMAVLKTGFDILFKQEGVELDKLQGHGGIFKTKGVAQSYLAAATNTPISVMTTAGEGGAWGIAILASYMIQKADGEGLAEYLEEKVFAGQEAYVMDPDPADVAGFEKFMEVYTAGLAIERAAVDSMQ